MTEQEKQEIKEALNNKTAGTWKVAYAIITAVMAENEAIAANVKRNDAPLIANAPEWIQQLLNEVEKWEKEARLQYRLFNEQIEENHFLEEKNKLLQEALRFYADDDNWRGGLRMSSSINCDGGDIARQALENNHD